MVLKALSIVEEEVSNCSLSWAMSLLMSAQSLRQRSRSLKFTRAVSNCEHR